MSSLLTKKHDKYMSNNIDNQQNTEDHPVTNYIVGEDYM
jgi:hypothetical protein